jgi:hypothetical protein
MKTGISLLTITLLILVSLAGNVMAGKWTGKEVVEDGVKHLKNTATGILKSETVSPDELWRIGGDSDDEDEMFGLISGITVDDAGQVFLIDSQLMEVKVFSPDGEFVRVMGGPGEAPGEFNNAAGIFFTPTGNLGVQQAFPARIVQFSADGGALDDYPLPKPEDGGFVVYAGSRNAGDALVMIGIKQVFGEGSMDRTTYLVRINAEIEEEAIYHEESVHVDFANIVVDEREADGFASRWLVTGGGNVVLAPSHQDYILEVWNADGKIKHIIEREYKHRKRNTEEKAFAESVYNTVLRQAPNAKIEVNDFHKDIMSIYNRDDGTIWVLTSDGRFGCPEGAIGVFDVFDDKGIYQRQVTIMGEGDPNEDMYFFIGKRLYVAREMISAAVSSQGLSDDIATDEDAEPMSVICYELGF